MVERGRADDVVEVPLGSTVAHYRVQRLLATGGMGSVYVATDLMLARQVALKVFRLVSEDQQAMLAEARITARFNHPHVVTVHGAGVIDGLTWVALELVEGGTLRDRLDGKPLPVPEALRIVRAVAEALSEAHRLGVVHADLKPENVLLPDDGRLRVADFGLSLHVGEGEGGAGSPAYMAPERWRLGPVTTAIDIWSLGILLFELLTGSRAVPDAELGPFVMRPHVIEWPAVLRGLPGAAVLQRMLAVDPAARPSAREVVEAAALRDDARSSLKPFRGLRPFTEDDAADLVGRELDVDYAIEGLRRHGHVLVAGRSGLGKSSLLAAGLSPRFRELGWRSVSLRPGASPLRRLGAALGCDGDELAEVLAHPRSIAAVVMRSNELVLVIDQLEEAFTLATDADRTAFFDALAALLDTRAGRLVLGLREDHLANVASALGGRVLTSTLLLQPLGRPALLRAVTQPLARVGGHFESPQLLDALVDDVVHSRVALPLLQFVCELLWDARDRQTGTIRRADYESLGGASGALATHAERTLNALGVEERQHARAVMLRLVGGSGSRVPCRQSTLLEIAPHARAVIDRFVEERLLVSTRDADDDSPLVELAHEALIAEWPTLRGWLDETLEERSMRDDVEQAAARWHRRGSRDDDTWGGTTLVVSLERERTRPLGLSQTAVDFLSAGRRRDETQRVQARRRATALVAALSLIAVGGVAGTVVTLSQQREIRLAASNSGQFELRLRPFVLELDGGRRDVPVESVGAISWSLAPAPFSRTSSVDELVPYGADALELQPRGGATWLVRAPAAPAMLQVTLGDCAPSSLRLETLPGFEKTRDTRPVVEVPVPVCSTSDLVTVPEGPFLSFDDDRVELPAFSIERTEVTVARYAAWSSLRALTGEDDVPLPPYLAGNPQWPMAGVSAQQADAFCRYLGRRLPDAQQWLKAARGGLTVNGVTNPAPARHEPWGNEVVAGRANWSGEAGDDVTPALMNVGALEADVSPYGVRDLAGNVSEWTSTVATSEKLRGLRIVLGGHWDMPADAPVAAIDFANTRPPQAVEFRTGFRCVSAATSPTPSLAKSN